MTMHILLSGANGLIGSACKSQLALAGHTVTELTRHPQSHKQAIGWDIKAGQLDLRQLPPLDAVIHLAGESIMGLWSASKKAAIYESRIAGTRLLVKALSELEQPPKVLLAGSAVGYYGNQGSQPLFENSPLGQGFLAEVCRDWEAEALKAEALGVRVVLVRTSVVLSRKGGALAAMLPPFQLGLGGRLGSGQQYMSWISIDDMVRALYFALENDSLSGPVNFCSPQPVSNAEFTSSLGQLLQRPTLLGVPSLALKLALGEMAEEMLLASQRAQPAALLKAGFNFQYPQLALALRHVLGRA